MGITNQRETTAVWDRKTGKAIHNALVWQDTRTQGVVDELSKDGGLDRIREQMRREKTGSVLYEKLAS